MGHDEDYERVPNVHARVNLWHERREAHHVITCQNDYELVQQLPVLCFVRLIRFHVANHYDMDPCLEEEEHDLEAETFSQEYRCD